MNYQNHSFYDSSLVLQTLIIIYFKRIKTHAKNAYLWIGLNERFTREWRTKMRNSDIDLLPKQPADHQWDYTLNHERCIWEPLKTTIAHELFNRYFDLP